VTFIRLRTVLIILAVIVAAIVWLFLPRKQAR
jgi:hypothetical protein